MVLLSVLGPRIHLDIFCEQQIRSLSWWPTSWPIWTTPLLGGAVVKEMHVRKLWILDPHIPTLGAPISMMKHGCRTPPLPTFGAGGPTIPLQIPSSRRRRAFLGGCPAAAPPNIAAKGSGRRAKRMNFSAKLSSSKVWGMKPEHSQYHVPNLPFFAVDVICISQRRSVPQSVVMVPYKALRTGQQTTARRALFFILAAGHINALPGHLVRCV